MKLHALCAFIALIPSALLAADNITVEATFIQAKSRNAVPHDMRKLANAKGIDVLSCPRVTTRNGQSAQVSITREFSIYSVGPKKHPLVPTGVVLNVTPSFIKTGVAFTAQITLREYESLSPAGADPKATFISRETYTSGTPKTGEEVWVDLPGRNGQIAAVRLVFKRVAATAHVKNEIKSAVAFAQ